MGTDCYPKQQQLRPLSGGVSPLEEGVLEQPPTPPSSPAAPLHDGGVLGESTTPSLTPTTPTDDQNKDYGSRGDGRTGPLGGGVLQEPEEDENDDGEEEEDIR